MRWTILPLLAAMLALAAGGCGSDQVNGTPTNDDATTVFRLASADESGDPDLAGMALTDEQLDESAPGVALLRPMAAIPDSVRVCWYRHLSASDKAVNVSGNSTLMTATVIRVFTGALKGVDCSSGHAPADSVLFDKPFEVAWTRTAQYVKMASVTDSSEDSTRWVLHATSLALATQYSPTGVNLPQIQSVTLTGTDAAGQPVQIQFTDPTALIVPAALPRFASGDTVRIKVVTDSPATQAAFIHFDMASSDRGRCQRRPLVYVAADNALEGVFHVVQPHGSGHPGGLRARTAVWVDVLSPSTLRDTAAPYAAAGWGIPYRLHKEKAAPLALR